MNSKNHPNHIIFKSVSEALLSLKCTNEECVGNKNSIISMYELNFKVIEDLNSFNFKVTNPCCEDFGSKLKSTAISVFPGFR